MKRLIAFLTLATLLTVGVMNQVHAQTQGTGNQTVTQTQTTPDSGQSAGFHQMVKKYFIEGGAGFMTSILLCLILGLAISIERTLYLNLSQKNTKKLINKL
jgi:biopolymer transport protein ExbB